MDARRVDESENMPETPMSSREVRKLSCAAQSITKHSDLLHVVDKVSVYISKLRNSLDSPNFDFLRNFKGLFETVLGLVLSAYTDHAERLALDEHSKLLQLLLDVPVSVAVQSIAQQLSFVQNASGVSSQVSKQNRRDSRVSVEAQETDLLLEILVWRVHGKRINTDTLTIIVGKEQALKVCKCGTRAPVASLIQHMLHDILGEH
jgi:hypothetical protein